MSSASPLTATMRATSRSCRSDSPIRSHERRLDFVRFTGEWVIYYVLLALGGGVTLVNVCDLAIISEDAQIGVPQIEWGIYPGIAGASAQLRCVHKHGAWQVLTGRRYGAAAAVDMGVVNFAVPAGKLEGVCFTSNGLLLTAESREVYRVPK